MTTNYHVILTYFNRPNCVTHAIKSLAAQVKEDVLGRPADFNIKIWAVDDNSSETNYEYLVDQLNAANIPHELFRTNITDEDRHKTTRYSVCINQVLNHLRHNIMLPAEDLIAYMCDDTVYYPHKIATVVNFFKDYLNEEDDALIAHNYTEVRRAIITQEDLKVEPQPLMVLNQPCDYSRMMQGPEYNHIDHHAVTHRMQCIYEMESPYWNEGPENWNHGDWTMWTHLLLEFGRMATIPQILDIKLQHQANSQMLVEDPENRWVGIKPGALSREKNFE